MLFCRILQLCNDGVTFKINYKPPSQQKARTYRIHRIQTATHSRRRPSPQVQNACTVYYCSKAMVVVWYVRLTVYSASNSQKRILLGHLIHHSLYTIPPYRTTNRATSNLFQCCAQCDNHINPFVWRRFMVLRKTRGVHRFICGDKNKTMNLIWDTE